MTSDAAQDLETYLASGGKLTAPDNVPARYRAELLRLMATFIDSELAGAAGFADLINAAPSLGARIAAARIVMEKLENARRVLAVMGEFGTNTDRYVTAHPWSDRLPRNASIGATRAGADMRLSVFHYPVEGWVDAVAMNVVMGEAAKVQLGEFEGVSYQPLALAFRQIRAVEDTHLELGIAGLQAIIGERGGREAVREAVAYWRPRVADSFGASDSARFERLARYGLRRRENAGLRAEWERALDATLKALGV
ncbi:MAG TPA: phenylacetate-CoA oxygenase subunit PaaI [Rhizobiaceae bacterium]|nr:phenylacetate-CoA oxygenase subunit PaaI [Rhizobiaceae bacterium]